MDSTLREGLVKHQQRFYLSYLLRIWKDPDSEGKWTFSLEDTGTGKRVGFVSLGRLADHLAKSMEKADAEIDDANNVDK